MRKQATMRIIVPIIYLSFQIHFPCCSETKEADLNDDSLFFCFWLGLGRGAPEENVRKGGEVELGVFLPLFFP